MQQSLEQCGPDVSAASRTAARVRPTTWLFDFSLQMPLFSDPEAVCLACLQILDIANKKSAIKGLVQSSFSYDVPCEGGLANICGYLVLCRPVCGAVHRLGHYRRACCLRLFRETGGGSSSSVSHHFVENSHCKLLAIET